MSIGTAIVVVGVLALFVFGPRWWRMLCGAAVVACVAGGAYLYEQSLPAAVAEKSFDPDAFIAAHQAPHPVPTCTAARWRRSTPAKRASRGWPIVLRLASSFSLLVKQTPA